MVSWFDTGLVAQLWTWTWSRTVLLSSTHAELAVQQQKQLPKLKASGHQPPEPLTLAVAEQTSVTAVDTLPPIPFSYGLRQIGLYGTTTTPRRTACTPHITSRLTTRNSPRPRRDAEKFWAETETRPKMYCSETETRPRRDVSTSRDRLETETSRPRPHSCY